jgi:chemotaxis signal transduction protein
MRVVIRINGQAVGLIVDRVSEVLDIPKSEVERRQITF